MADIRGSTAYFFFFFTLLDQLQGPPFMDGFGEMQPNMENEINGMRPLFGPLSDILRWTLNEADNRLLVKYVLI